MPTDEKNVEFEADDTSLDSIYDDDSFSEFDDEEDQDDEEKSSSKFESTPNNGRKKKLILGAIAGIVAVVIGTGIYQSGQNRKKADRAAQQQEQQNQGKAVKDGTQTEETTDTSVLNVPGSETPVNGGIPCNNADPNDPNNINNPNCQLQQNGVVNTQGLPAQSVQDQNGNPIPQQPNVQQQNGQEYNQQANNNYQNYNQPTYTPRQPKAEKQLPPPMAAYTPKEITKPTASLGTAGSGNKNSNTTNNNNNNNAAVTTNGTQGQTQEQADAINNSQNRIRPTNNIKKADNKTTFLLQTGSYIPLAMTTTLNSDNPSFFMGIVRENVYTQNGQHRLLIPMGSKVIGNYKALSSNTATRMFMFVEKIILPNQEVIAFSNENVVDLQGEIGTRGKLNSRFWQRLGNTTLALTFSAADLALDFRRAKAATKAAENNSNISSSTWEEVLGSPTQTVKGLTKELNDAWTMPKNKIKVPIGYRLNVMLANDIVLQEYKGR